MPNAKSNGWFVRKKQARLHAWQCRFFEQLEMRTLLDAAPLTPTPLELQELTRVFQEEFTNASGAAIAPDPAMWHAETNADHLGEYTPQAVSVNPAGELEIKTYNDDSTGERHYKTGAMLSKGFEFKYGYAEARIKFDGRPGQWSAFWLNQDTVYGAIGDPALAGQEVDIAEVLSHPAYDAGDATGVHRGDDMVHIKSNTIWDSYDYQRNHTSTGDVAPYMASQRVGGFEPRNFATEYHVYGVNWTPRGYTFYIDGVKTGELNHFVSQRALYLKLSSDVLDDVEKSWCYPIRPDGFGPLGDSLGRNATMTVDYVAVYQQAPLFDYRSLGTNVRRLAVDDMELAMNAAPINIATPAETGASYRYAYTSSNPNLISDYSPTTPVLSGTPLPIQPNPNQTGTATLTISATSNTGIIAETTLRVQVTASAVPLDGGFEHVATTVETIHVGDGTNFQIQALSTSGNAWTSVVRNGKLSPVSPNDPLGDGNSYVEVIDYPRRYSTGVANPNVNYPRYNNVLGGDHALLLYGVNYWQERVGGGIVNRYSNVMARRTVTGLTSGVNYVLGLAGKIANPKIFSSDSVNKNPDTNPLIVQPLIFGVQYVDKNGILQDVQSKILSQDFITKTVSFTLPTGVSSVDIYARLDSLDAAGKPKSLIAPGLNLPGVDASGTPTNKYFGYIDEVTLTRAADVPAPTLAANQYVTWHPYVDGDGIAADTQFQYITTVKPSTGANTVSEYFIAGGKDANYLKLNASGETTWEPRFSVDPIHGVVSFIDPPPPGAIPAKNANGTASDSFDVVVAARNAIGRVAEQIVRVKIARGEPITTLLSVHQLDEATTPGASNASLELRDVAGRNDNFTLLSDAAGVTINNAAGAGQGRFGAIYRRQGEFRYDGTNVTSVNYGLASTILDDTIDLFQIDVAPTSITIPLAVEQTIRGRLQNPFTIRLGDGDDAILNKQTAINVNLRGGSGVNTLSGAEAATLSNYFTISGTNQGTLRIVDSGGTTLSQANWVDFLRLNGGANYDDFTFEPAASLFLDVAGAIDGRGGLLDTIRAARGAKTKFSLADNALAIETASAGLQTFQLANIERAYLTVVTPDAGNSSNDDTFDLTGWTRSGDGTATNDYGGVLNGGAGVDRLVYKGDINRFTAADNSLTADSMRMRLMGRIRLDLEDQGATTPTIFDLAGYTRPGTFKATTSNAATTKLNKVLVGTAAQPSTATNIVLRDDRIALTRGATVVYHTIAGIGAVAIVASTNADHTVTYNNYAMRGGQTFVGGTQRNKVILGTYGGNLDISDAALHLSGGDVPFDVDYSTPGRGFSDFEFTGDATPNVVTLSNWSGTGTLSLGGQTTDVDDRLIVDQSRSSTPFVFDLAANGSLAMNGRRLIGAGIDDITLIGGAGNDTFTLNDWKNNATINGTGGIDSLNVARDRGMTFSRGAIDIEPINVERRRTIAYNNVERLATYGGSSPSSLGSGANVYTLQSDFDANLEATASGFSISLGGGYDTVRVVNSTRNVTASNGVSGFSLAVGSSALAFPANDQPEALDLSGTGATYLIDGYDGTVKINNPRAAVTVRNDVDFFAGLQGGKYALSVGTRNYTLSQFASLNLVDTSPATVSRAMTILDFDKPLRLDGGVGFDRLNYGRSIETNFVLSDASLIGGSATVVLVPKSFEFAELKTTAATNDTFDVSGWSGDGSILAGGQTLGGSDRLLLDGSHSGVVLGKTSLSLSSGGVRGTWTHSGIEAAEVDAHDALLNLYIDASNFPGPTTITGGFGHDTIFGGLSDDLLLGGAGNDLLFGGSGNDALEGGSGDDWLGGDGGFDTLRGGAGKNILVGGQSRDTLIGGGAGDIMIPGYTAYDAYSAENRAIIQRLLAVWGGSSVAIAYETLFTIGVTGAGFSGKAFLHVKSSVNDTIASTVFDDAIVDSILASANQDWHFIKKNGAESTLDVTGNDLITDLSP